MGLPCIPRAVPHYLGNWWRFYHESFDLNGSRLWHYLLDVCNDCRASVLQCQSQRICHAVQFSRMLFRRYCVHHAIRNQQQNHSKYVQGLLCRAKEQEVDHVAASLTGQVMFARGAVCNYLFWCFSCCLMHACCLVPKRKSINAQTARSRWTCQTMTPECFFAMPTIDSCFFAMPTISGLMAVETKQT
jgi:hypothetical protein